MRLIGLAVVLGLVTAPLTVEAQHASKGGVARIGVVWSGQLPGPPLSSNSPLVLFHQSLRALGYVEGQTISIESRFVTRRPYADVIAELVVLPVQLIVAMGTPQAWAAKNTTTSTPVVFSVLGDPVELGLVRSLARPGGNLTGLHVLSPEQSGKRLNLLKETVPHMRRVGVLWNPDSPLSTQEFSLTETAARALALKLQSLPARDLAELDTALETAVKGRADGLTVLTSPVTAMNQRRIAEFCVKKRLPAIYWQDLFADRGGLMAYGASTSEEMQRVASYVDRILKGAKPADLPVEQPTKFELVINLKTGKAFGLAIPPSVLARADRVIQ